MSIPIVLGVEYQTGEFITVDHKTLESGLYCVGNQGTGKSSLMVSFALQEIAQGECVIVLDPGGGGMLDDIMARMPEERVKDTFLLDLKHFKFPFWLDIFSCSNRESREARVTTAYQIMHSFEKLWPETVGQVYIKKMLRHLIPIMIDHPDFTLAHLPRFLSDDNFRNDFLATRNIPDKDFWLEYNDWSRTKREEQTKTLRDRLDEFLWDEWAKYIVCQTPGGKNTPVNIREIIDKKRILLVNLPIDETAYKYATPTIGTFLMSMIYSATFSYANLPYEKKPGFTLCVDEFAVFSFVFEEFKDIFGRARKHRIRQFLAHQYRGQLKGLSTIAQATTTAETIITLKVDDSDSKEMAAYYGGLTTRPTDFYIDVLNRLEKHKNATLKEFYWHTIRPLQQAAKMSIERRTGDQPSSDFGFGAVSFTPHAVTTLLNILNNLLYQSQKTGHVHQQLFETFWQGFLKLNEVVAYREVPDPEGVQKRQAIDAQIAALKRMERGAVALSNVLIQSVTNKVIEDTVWSVKTIDIEIMKSANAESPAAIKQRVLQYTKDFPFAIPEKLRAISRRIQVIQQQLEVLWHARDKLYRKVLALAGIPEKDFSYLAWEYGIDDAIKTGRGLKNRLYAPQWIERKPDGTYILHSKEVVEYTRLLQEQRILEHVKFFYEQAEKKRREDATDARRKLEETRQTIAVTRKVEEERLVKYKEYLRGVVLLLISQPLAADSEQSSAVAIAQGILNLPMYQAYVKVGAKVARIKTLDFKQQFPVTCNVRERKNTIERQTKQTYCRGRKEVEREIERIYHLVTVFNNGEVLQTNRVEKPEEPVKKSEKKIGDKSRQQTSGQKKLIDEEDDIIE